MVRGNLRAVVAAVAAGVVLAPATAAEPPHYTFSPKPPGSIVQSVLFYPAGEGMQTQWRAVSSRIHLGGAAYQWYLSVYSIDFDIATYRLVYQSPRDGGPALRVRKTPRSDLWLPLQSLYIVGEGALEEPSVENLIVQEHRASGDCGSATVTVYGYAFRTRRFGAIASVSNPCALEATIEHDASGDVVRLSGPYYAPGAALCCPTKPRASAYLRFKGGRWVEAPVYFPLHA
jgi:hypothetical protein